MLPAIACRILSEFSVACLERVLFSEGEREGLVSSLKAGKKTLGASCQAKAS